MDLDFTEEQDLLRETVRRICESRFDSKTIRALEREEDKLDREFWVALGENGLCALRIGEAHGGAAMGALDMAVVFEEFGHALASSPFLQSCVHAPAILLSVDGPEAQDLMPKIATGETILIPAWEESDLFDAESRTEIGSDGTLSGAKAVVPFASVADAFLVSTSSGWALVDSNAAGITVDAQANYASQPLFQVRFDRTPVRVAFPSSGPPFAQASFTDVLIADAAEAVGSATRLLAMTTDYANQRKQFGKPIAAFQAISHPLAECATELEGARYLTYQAAWAQDEGQDATHLARMAKVTATALFRRLATLSVQVHGGIGYSSEGEPQLFYRRSKYHQLMHGTARDLKAAIADRVLG